MKPSEIFRVGGEGNYVPELYSFQKVLVIGEFKVSRVSAYGNSIHGGTPHFQVCGKGGYLGWIPMKEFAKLLALPETVKREEDGHAARIWQDFVPVPPANEFRELFFARFASA